MYAANRPLIAFLLLYLAGQVAAAMWQYTASGRTIDMNPINDYEYHGQSVRSSTSLQYLTDSIGQLVYTPHHSECVFDSQRSLLQILFTHGPRSGHFSTLYVSLEVGFDSLVFFLTVFRTVYMHHQARKELAQLGWNDSETTTTGAISPRPTLLDRLVKDGALYFA